MTTPPEFGFGPLPTCSAIGRPTTARLTASDRRVEVADGRRRHGEPGARPDAGTDRCRTTSPPSDHPQRPSDRQHLERDGRFCAGRLRLGNISCSGCRLERQRDDGAGQARDRTERRQTADAERHPRQHLPGASRASAQARGIRV